MFQSLFTHTLAFLFSIFFSLTAWTQINIKTDVNAKKIGTEDVLVLTYSFTAPRGGIEEYTPTFKGFRVVMRNKSIFNSDHEYTYQLQAMSPGEYEIPALTIVDKNGQVSKSQTFKVTVVKGALLNNSRQARPQNMPSAQDQIDKIREQLYQQNPFAIQGLGKIEDHFFVLAETSKNTYYLGEPIEVVYKLYNNTGFSNANIVAIPNQSNFISKNFDFEQDPEEKIETYNGQNFRTFTIKKAILYGYKTGEFEVGDLVISAFVDYFGKAEAHTKRKTITIKPLPPVPQGLTFQGGVGQYSISSQFDQINTSTDNPITLSITVTGNGNMESTSMPLIDWPAGITVSEPTIDIINKDNNPLISSKNFTYHIYAEKETSVKIPEIKWTYFDHLDGSYKTLLIPEQQLTFFPGKNSNDSSVVNAPGDGSTDIENEKESHKWTYIIIAIIGAVTLMGGWVFYKKKNKEYQTPVDTEPLIQEPISSPHVSQKNGGIQAETPQMSIPTPLPPPIKVSPFDTSGLEPKFRDLNKAELIKISENFILNHFQNFGYQAENIDQLTQLFKYDQLTNEGSIKKLEDIKLLLSIWKYNPLPLSESDRVELIQKLEALSHALKNDI